MASRPLTNRGKHALEDIHKLLVDIDRVLAEVAPENKPLGTRAAIQMRTYKARMLAAQAITRIALAHPGVEL